MKLLSNIGYLRENAPERLAFKQIGRVFYDEAKHQCRIFLFAFRQGLCIAKPDGDAPFLQGDILCPVGVFKDEVQYAYVGFIATAETMDTDRAHIYSITLEAMPLVLSDAKGVWLFVELEDSGSFTDNKPDCPF